MTADQKRSIAIKKTVRVNYSFRQIIYLTHLSDQFSSVMIMVDKVGCLESVEWNGGLK